MRNEAVELVKAGDKCVFTGTLVVIPDVAQLYSNGEGVVAARMSSRSGGGAGRNAISGLFLQYNFSVVFRCSMRTLFTSLLVICAAAVALAFN